MSFPAQFYFFRDASFDLRQIRSGTTGACCKFPPPPYGIDSLLAQFEPSFWLELVALVVSSLGVWKEVGEGSEGSDRWMEMQAATLWLLSVVAGLIEYIAHAVATCCMRRPVPVLVVVWQQLLWENCCFKLCCTASLECDRPCTVPARVGHPRERCPHSNGYRRLGGDCVGICVSLAHTIDHLSERVGLMRQSSTPRVVRRVRGSVGYWKEGDDQQRWSASTVAPPSPLARNPIQLLRVLHRPPAPHQPEKLMYSV
jgi:hypothetical protein